MLDEIIIKTRGEGDKDFVWFTPGGVNEKWNGRYKSAFYDSNKDFHLFAEIENGNYRVYFDKIRRPWTITRGGIQSKPFVDLMAFGKCGSDSSKAVFKILSNFFFGNKDQVESLFAQFIPKEYIENVFQQAKTEEIRQQIAVKLESIVSNLSDIIITNNDSLADNVYVFDSFEAKKKTFFSELSRITLDNKSDGVISLVLTQCDITNEYLEKFEYNLFSNGLCLTTGNVENGRIEKTIKANFTKVGTSTTTNAPTQPQPTPPITTEPALTKTSSTIPSNPNYNVLLIILIGIILMLILVVRSCVCNTENELKMDSPTIKVQDSLPSFLKDTTKQNK